MYRLVRYGVIKMGFMNLFNFGKKGLKINKKYLKEVREFVNDVKESLHLENAEYKFLDSERAVVNANSGNNIFNATLDFSKKRMEQTLSNSCYALTIGLPNIKNRATTIGTIDGIPKIRKNVQMRTGKNTDVFIETTDYHNLVSGNKYRRIHTPQGYTFQKMVNGNYVNLFPKP